MKEFYDITFLHQIMFTLIVGGYVYGTGIYLLLTRKIDHMRLNHIKHLLKAINEVRKEAGLPPAELENGNDID